MDYEDIEEERSKLEDDYYAFLNVPRDATKEDINNAYRRMSRIYHPDKHTDPVKKKDAEILFHKTKKAYEVLSDPHKRAIYDNLGTQGLETEGWEIVQRTKTAQEIREEYERLAREREEERLKQRTNARGIVTLNINATELFSQNKDDEDEFEDFGLPLMEISGMSISLSTDAPLTLRNKMTIGGEISTQNGTGSGALTLSGRRLLENNKWIEATVHCGNDVSIHFKHYRSLTRRVFGTGNLQFYFANGGITAVLETTLGTQLAENTMGYIVWRAGSQSSMITTVAHNRDNYHVEGSIALGIPHSFISLSGSYNFKQQKLKMRSALKYGTFGTWFEYSAEKKVSEQSSVSAAVSVGSPSGVRLRIKLVRAGYTFILPIHLCEEPSPSPVFYATLVPLVVYAVIKRTVIDPIMVEQKELAKEKERQSNKTRMAEMKKEAIAAVKLMEATFSRIRSDEESKNGLVIVKALYGQLATLSAPTDGERIVQDEVIDVTIPVQCLVISSKLSLHESSKSQLAGFYDPCVGEDKALYIQYLWHSHLSEVICPDKEPLTLPKLAHRINPN